MFKKISIIFLFILLINSYSYAQDKSSFSPFFTAGEKSQTDGTEERDVSGSFKYSKYGFSSKLIHKDGLSSKFKFEEYNKNFTSDKYSDVNSRKYYTGVNFPIFKNNDCALYSDFDIYLRSKRYKTTKNIDFNQINSKASLEYKKNDFYSIGIAGGLNNYDFINDSNKDVLKTFAKMFSDFHLFNKFLSISNYLRIQRIDNAGDRDNTTETIASVSAALNIDRNYIDKLKATVTSGKENTQDTEDREEHLRYKFTKWQVSSYHKLSEKLKTNFKYSQNIRDYVSDLNDYDNWAVENNTDIMLKKSDLFNLSFFLDTQHKETDFDKINTKSYIKNQATSGLNFVKKSRWAFKPEFSFTKYNYTSESSEDHCAYKTKLFLRKYFLEDTMLEAYYWYKWKDYKNKPDDEQWTLNLSITMKF